MLRAVTFDATGTLFHCPRLGEIHSEVLGRHGLQVDPERARSLVATVWAELDCAAELGRDRFSAHPGGPRGWWTRFVDRVCEHLGYDGGSRFVAAELYDRFSHAESWELYPDVIGALDELAADGVGLAVVSNWDPRLPGLLGELGIAGRFSHVVYSAEVGFEKPHPGIFESALARLALEPEEALHVGDSRRLDVEGAQAVGMRAVHLDRAGDGEIASLAQLQGAADRLWYVASRST